MGLTEIVLGIGAIGSATIGCAMYGVTDAKGTPMPGREYVWPATAVAALWAGSKAPLPDNGPSKGFGVICTATLTAVGAASYGVGYLFGSLS